jgi:hypothetical protein
MGCKRAGLGLHRLDANETERGIELIDRAQRVDSWVRFGAAAAKQEIGLAFVAASGGDGHDTTLYAQSEAGYSPASTSARIDFMTSSLSSG